MRENISSNCTGHAADLLSQRKSNRGFEQNRITIGLTFLLVAAVLTACSPATPTLSPTVPVLPTSTTAVASPTSAPAEVQGSASTSLDPCQLITSQEASQLAGASFGPGEESTDVGGLKMCTYGAQTTNVFLVEVVQAPDAATAQAQKGQFMAFLQTQLPQLTNSGLKITQLPNLGDGGIMGEANLAAINVNGGAIGVVKGKTFFGFSDLVQGGQAPTSEALQSEATTVLARLP